MYIAYIEKGIGDRSRITDLAKRIDGEIVQMSMGHWVREVCQILKRTIGFVHPIADMTMVDSLKYIEEKTRTIDLSAFLS